MKIIHWNCQGAFRKKHAVILAYKPDILIISECEHPSRLEFGKLVPEPVDYFWYGDNPHKGVCFLFYNQYSYRIHKVFNSKFRYIIPLIVKTPKLEFNLFGIWAMGDSEKRSERYIGQVWMALNAYKSMLSQPSILIGDFNSNQIWDTKARVGNHTAVVNLLRDYEIESLYHKQYQLEHGNEEHPTFYLYRKKDKPYHLDYCFASQSILAKGYEIEIGSFDKWIKDSDHTPIIVNIDS